MKYPQLVSMPSAVSDWLEEQLEARGIDSEVYTRYILSLLHAHTLDDIYPEDDLTFSKLKKDGGRGVVSHKRSRRTNTWWRHAQADAEQIKRSAAVQCLMSAAEQSCEIESLVDELCEKLKEVNPEGDHSPSKSNQDPNIFKEPFKLNPKELAERYFAAFPPLNNKEDNSYFSSNIHLVSGKWPSPEKEQVDLVATKWTNSGSPRKAKRKTKRQLKDTNLKPAFTMSNNGNRFGHKRTHCGRNLTKEMADNIANWEFVYNNNNNYQNEDQCLSPIMAEAFPDDVDMCDEETDDNPICRIYEWLNDVDSETASKPVQVGNWSKRKRLYEKKPTPTYFSLYPSTIWSDNNASLNNNNNRWADNNFGIESTTAQDGSPEKYSSTAWQLDGEDCAIREEYQQHKPKPREVESAIKDEYDRPYGNYRHLDSTPHLESLWDCNRNESVIQIEEDEGFAYGYNEVDRDRLKKQDDEFIRENNANRALELGSSPSLPFTFCAQCSRDSNSNNQPEAEHCSSFIADKTLTFKKVNHSLCGSAFKEYSPSQPTLLNQTGPFSRPFGRPIKRPHPANATIEARKVPVVASPWITDEQKKCSSEMYFTPIKEIPLPAEKEERVYEDGTTFLINANIDKVKFKRSSSGSLMVETEFGESKKYLEYTWRSPSNKPSIPKAHSSPEEEPTELTVKFWVKSNDKSCQTSENSNASHEDGQLGASADYRDIFQDLADSDDGDLLDWNTLPEKLGQELEDHDSTNSLCETDEIDWSYDPKIWKNSNAKYPWPNNLENKNLLDWNTMKDIWCEPKAGPSWDTKAEGSTLPVDTKAKLEADEKLREEMNEEAESLLSDLNSLQLTLAANMVKEEEEEGELKNNVELGIVEPVKNDDGPREKKRRHSYMDNNTDMWSFATRLQEDFLINDMPTVPTRRSVTL